MNEMSRYLAKGIQKLAFAAVVAMLAGTGAAEASDNAPSLSQAIGALVYEPRTDALYRSDGRALYRRSMAGREWTKVSLTALPDGSRIAAISVSAGEQSQLYLAGPGLGVLKSVDAGKSWSHIDQGLPSREVIAFAAHSTAPDTLFAVVAGEGIYRSEDGSVRWRMVDKGPDAKVRRFIHSNLEGSMQSGWLFAATDKGAYRSMDCFCGWRPAGSLPGPVAAVTYDPNRPKELYAAVGEQLYRTVNGGEEWEAAGSPGTEITALAHSRSGVLYALLADGRVVHRSRMSKRWQ